MALRIQSSKAGETAITADAAPGLFAIPSPHGPLTLRLQTGETGVCWDGYAERGSRAPTR